MTDFHHRSLFVVDMLAVLAAAVPIWAAERGKWQGSLDSQALLRRAEQ
jgi:hypothetical protein